MKELSLERDMKKSLPLWDFPMEGKRENITNIGLPNLCWTTHPFENLMKIKGSLYRKKKYGYTHHTKFCLQLQGFSLQLS